jgi:hypothetical protein
MDFNSLKFPFMTKFFDDQQQGEAHEEPNNEAVRTSVVDYDHPLLSTTGIKNIINTNRKLGNSDEKLLEDDVKKETLMDIIQAAYKNKFPIEVLTYALDVKQKLDERSGASDANDIISQIKQYVPALKSSLGRQPFNSEVFMAYMLQNAGQVKTLLDKAKDEPYELSSPVGSQYDDIIFYKLKLGEKTLRKNREVIQYFAKRMQVGQNVFPYTPFDVGIQNAV